MLLRLNKEHYMKLFFVYTFLFCSFIEISYCKNFNALDMLNKDSKEFHEVQSNPWILSQMKKSANAISLHIKVTHGSIISTAVKSFTVEIKGDSSTGYYTAKDSLGKFILSSGTVDFYHVPRGLYAISAYGINSYGQKFFSLKTNLTIDSKSKWCTINISNKTVYCQ